MDTWFAQSPFQVFPFVESFPDRWGLFVGWEVELDWNGLESRTHPLVLYQLFFTYLLILM